jgi:hypothetical protein
MHWTVEALGRRLAGLRGLAFALGLVVLLSCVASIGFRSWRPLCGLFLAIPLCGASWCRDATRIDRWQGRIFGPWCEGRLDLDVLAETLLLTPGLPTPLLRGMLETLPTRSRGFPRLMPDLRHATGMTIRALNHCHRDRTATATLAYAVVWVSLAWSLHVRSLLPIAGGFLIVPLLGVSQLAALVHLRRWRRQIGALVREGLDPREFAAVARRLDWGRIPSRTRERWLQAALMGPQGSSG